MFNNLRVGCEMAYVQKKYSFHVFEFQWPSVTTINYDERKNMLFFLK